MKLNFSLIVVLIVLKFNNCCAVFYRNNLLDANNMQLAKNNGNTDSTKHSKTIKKEKKFHYTDRLWKKDELSYTILGNVAYYNQTSKEVIEKVVKEAFKEWRYYSPLLFSYRENFRQADIKIIFTRDSYSLDPHSNSYNHICEKTFHNNEAHAYFANHPFYPGEIHINNQVFWLESTKPTGNVSLKSILLHEIGHTVGLEHSFDRDSIMYPYFYTNTIKSITIRDAIELNSMYRKLCNL